MLAFKDAIEKNNPFSCVILDLTIPGGIGGKETITHLRKIDPNIAALVSSGYSDDPVMAEPQQFGFDGSCKKPYRKNDLLQLVARVLESKNTHMR